MHKKKHTFVYIPILDLLSKLLERSETLKLLKRSNQREGQYS